MQFTCNSCNLGFASTEDQRSHMKSDWHRYNLKRRVAQLPPIDEELFNSKVAALSISAEGDDNEQAAEGSKKQVTKKEQRRKEREALQEKKRQILEMAREAMAKREKEKEGEKTSEEIIEDSIKDNGDENNDIVTTEDQKEDGADDEDIEEKLMAEKIAKRVEIPITTCLFCHSKYAANFPTIDDNIQHMFTKHGLYIPEPKYLTDKEGLIKYLGEKIGLGNVCLCCNYQGRDIKAVREHMLNKRHMRIPYESEDEKYEISEFYDFSSTYEDIPVVSGEEVNDEEWEDVSDASDHGDDSDEEADTVKNAIYRDGYELILPSGATVGHRSLARYYRQNLPPERVLTQGQGTVIAAETRHMLTLRDRKELAEQKRSWGRQKKREDVNDRRAAKFINNQPHFRDQLLQ